MMMKINFHYNSLYLVNKMSNFITINIVTQILLITNLSCMNLIWKLNEIL